VQNSDNLKRRRLRAINDGVIGITGQGPETERTSCEVGAGMAAHGSFGNKPASVVNRLFYTVGRVFTVIGNVRPGVEISALARGVRTYGLIVWTNASRLSSLEFRDGLERCR
jgi:hypothetical protein